MAVIRRALHLSGVVQGVGFRPWAMRQARARGLGGGVQNTQDGVRVVLEGERSSLEAWLRALEDEPPPRARIEASRIVTEPPRGKRDFAVEQSEVSVRGSSTRIPPDVAICGACTEELFDPADRRYRYPFTHCADCGPRASVLRTLPYDRERTSLAAFPLCDACREEYEDPSDRRFHAEGIACGDCGPGLSARSADGSVPAGDPVEAAAACLAAGGIVALKGYGGFHLAVDATRADAVALLRKRKERPTKPFAVMVPDQAAAETLVQLSAHGRTPLSSVHAVVLAPRREAACRALGLAPEVAPGVEDLGLLLPVTPLHRLLLFAPGAQPGRDPARFPALVLTSANRSGEPTLHENASVRERLAGIADLVVEHDRDVARPNDDPVYRSAPGAPIPIRLSRATAPIGIPLPDGLRADPPILAIGGDLKCAPALARGGEVLIAEHLGDLGTVASADALEERVRGLCGLFGVEACAVAHDLHPEYLGSRIAGGLAARRIAVQHHHAHAASCLAEHGRSGPSLALVLDGAGFGPDGTVWGGELLRVGLLGCERVAHLERVRLPGGDAAVREPWRMAAMWLERAFPDGPPRLPWHARRDAARLGAVRAIAERGTRSPWTSSCGRLFDAVSSLLDLCDDASWEGEAALRLESAAAREAGGAGPAAAGPPPAAGAIPVADLVREIVLGRVRGEAAPTLARRFHAGLAARLAAAAAAAAGPRGLRSVVLSGGCLQNRLLAADLRRELVAAGLEPLEQRRVPANDGGLALGQAVVATARNAAATR